MEKFVVLNPTHGNISFVVFPDTVANSVAHVSSHKRRRLVRGKSTPVNILSRHSVDLVALTGFSIKEIKETLELHQFIRQGLLVVIEDSSSIKPIPVPILPDQAKPIPAPVLPPAPVVEVAVPKPVLVKDFIQELDPVEKEPVEVVEKSIEEDLEKLADSSDKSDKLKEKQSGKKKKKGKILFKKKRSKSETS